MLRALIFILGISITLIASAQQTDYIKEIVTMMGTIDALNADVERHFRKMRSNDPAHSSYYSCLESRMAPDAVIDKLRPFYRRTFSETNLRELYDLFRSDTGKKMIELIKAGPPFDARAKLNPEDSRRIQEVVKSFQHLFNPEFNVSLQRATTQGGEELAAEAKRYCQEVLQKAPNG
jgi:hypothetical protein